MRLLELIRADLRFLFRYGFIFMYAIFTALYLVLLTLLDDPWKQMVAALLVFTDPAAMGLFFMGAIIHLEKDERTLHSVALSPLPLYEYLTSKICSLTLLATAVGLVLGFAGGLTHHLWHYLPALILSSVFFTSLALAVATRTQSLNQFLVAVIPIELVANTPLILHLFSVEVPLGVLHPALAYLDLVLYRSHALLSILSLGLWAGGAFLLGKLELNRYMSTLGGYKR
ncbi:MAG: hypothetical protein WCS07_05280 [Sphaerochaeta sp.]